MEAKKGKEKPNSEATSRRSVIKGIQKTQSKRLEDRISLAKEEMMLKQSLKMEKACLKDLEKKVLEKGDELKEKKMQLEALQREGESGKLENIHWQVQNRVLTTKLRLKIRLLEDQLPKLERVYISKKKLASDLADRFASMLSQPTIENTDMKDRKLVFKESQRPTPSIFYAKQQPFTDDDEKPIKSQKQVTKDSDNELDGTPYEHLKTKNSGHVNVPDDGVQTVDNSNVQAIHGDRNDRISSYVQDDYLQGSSNGIPVQNIHRSTPVQHHHTSTNNTLVKKFKKCTPGQSCHGSTDGTPFEYLHGNTVDSTAKHLHDSASSTPLQYLHGSRDSTLTLFQHSGNSKPIDFCHGSANNTPVQYLHGSNTRTQHIHGCESNIPRCLHESTEYTPVQFLRESSHDQPVQYSEYCEFDSCNISDVRDDTEQQFYSETHADLHETTHKMRPLCFKPSGILNDIPVIFYGSGGRRGKIMKNDLEIVDLD